MAAKLKFKSGDRVRFTRLVTHRGAEFPMGTIDRMVDPVKVSYEWLCRTEKTVPVLNPNDGWSDPTFLEKVPAEMSDPIYQVGDAIVMKQDLHAYGVDVKCGTVTTIGNVCIFEGDHWTYVPMEFVVAITNGGQYPNNGWPTPDDLWEPYVETWRKAEYAWVLTLKPGDPVVNRKTGERVLFHCCTNSDEFAKERLADNGGWCLRWADTADLRYVCEDWAPVPKIESVEIESHKIARPRIADLVQSRFMAAIRGK